MVGNHDQIYFRMINPSGRKWREARLEPEVRRRLRIKLQMEQQQQWEAKEVEKGLVGGEVLGNRRHILLTG